MNSSMIEHQNIMQNNKDMIPYKPSGNGTLISDLIKKNNNNGIPTNKKTYNKQHINNKDNEHYDNVSINRSHTDLDSKSQYSNIEEIANDINHSLQELENIESRKKKRRNIKIDTETEDVNIDNVDNTYNIDKITDKITLETVEPENNYIKIFIEFTLLLTLYVILSQPFSISLMAKFFNQLNPTDDGNISLIGILIYGTLLTIVFMVLRKIIFKKLDC